MEQKTTAYSPTVETALAHLGLNPAETRGADPGQWQLFNGKTELFIDLWKDRDMNQWLFYEPEGEVYYFQVLSPVCYLPDEKREQLYEELLHNNLNMLYASYTINTTENILAIKYRRPAEGLTSDIVMEAIESVGYYSEFTFSVLSDRYDISPIKAEFE
jgi:hypothetical protein